MTAPQDDDRTAWIGRAAPPPRDPWPTAEQPAVAPVPPPVVYVRAPRRRWGLVVALLLLSFAAGAAVAVTTSSALRDAIGLGPDPTTPPPSESPTPSPTPTTPPPPGVGDPVQDGTFEFRVVDLSCGHEAVRWGLLRESADGQYCLVGVAVTNTGELPALFIDRAQYLVASDGSRHRADTTAGVIANEGISVWASLVLPDRTAAGTLVFDIPSGTTAAVVELHDSLFSDGTLVTIGPVTSPSAEETED